jgi:hypothetical protein
VAGGLAAALALGACGGSSQQGGSGHAHGNFPVAVSQASFPTSQRLAERTTLVIVVRNTGTRTIPNIAVTILNPRYGTAAQAFGQDINANPGQELAGRSRPAWIVDRPPGPCLYSCQVGAGGSAVTAFSNTWALGRLAPGQTARFEWGVTAVVPGHYTVEYEIGASLSGRARAVNAAGRVPTGRFDVVIQSKPRTSYINNAGQIVSTG